MPVTMTLEQRREMWLLTLSGELDYAECSGFRLQIDRILKAMPPAVVIDLSKLDYLDSSGLGLLLSLSREYGSSGGRIALVTNKTVDGILEITRLNGIFSVFRSLDQALAYVRTPDASA
jgi:anti-anti-sigma factor